MRSLIVSVLLLGLAQVGCGASLRVTPAETVQAKTQFEAIDARHKGLNKIMEKRLRGITESKLKPDAKYAFRRQALRKYAAEARKVLRAYVRLANTLPQDKTAHLWTYAAFVRGAFILDDTGRFAHQLKALYSADALTAANPSGEAYFAGIAKKAKRSAYVAYMRTLFLGYHYHAMDVEDPAHLVASNRWLQLANSRRCVVSKAEKLSKLNHSNMTWGMFKSAPPSGLDAGQLRGEVMTFMRVPANQHCQ